MKKYLVPLLLVTLLLSLVGGCSGAKTETDIAKDTVEELLNTFKNSDFEKLAAITGENIDDTEDTEQMKVMYNAIFSDMSWSFVSGEIKEGVGDLIYKVKSKEFSQLLPKIFAAALSGQVDPEDGESIKKFLEETIKAIPPIEKEITFKMKKEGESFTMEDVEDTMGKILGIDESLFGIPTE